MPNSDNTTGMALLRASGDPIPTTGLYIRLTGKGLGVEERTAVQTRSDLSVRKHTVSATQPSNPAYGDTWEDTS